MGLGLRVVTLAVHQGQPLVLGQDLDAQFRRGLQLGARSGPGDHQVLAFTDFGIETLVELIKIHRELSSTQS